MQQKKSWYAYLFSCVFIFALFLSFPRWKTVGGNSTISWDVTGYYTYLPAALIYEDLGGLNFRGEVLNRYYLSGLDHAGYLHEPSQKQVMKYPMGMALAYAPWFLVAHTMATLTSYPADGFSQPYHFFMGFGCVVYAFVGLWFLRKILTRYFDDGVAAITLLLIALGTNYLNYTAFDMAMPHNFLFTLYAILIWTTIRWYASPSIGKSIVIGVCIGWAALARPTEILAAMIPILWGLSNGESVRARFFLWKKHFGKLFIAAFTVFVIGMLQLLYWKSITGEWLVYSYQEQGFTWTGVHLRNCFFSYRKGWLIYTPMMFFAITGLFFLWEKNKQITFSEKHFWAVLLFFLLNTYLIFSWDIWWYGGGFGQRAMIPSYTLLALPLAALLEFSSKKLWSKILVGLPVLFCLWLNLHQTWQAHSPFGGFETEAMTKAYYWKIFGKTNFDPDWKILLDTDEEFLGEKKDLTTLYKNDFEAEVDSIHYDTRFTTSGNQALHMSKAVQYSKNYTTPLRPSTEADWVQATAHFYCANKEWNYWMMCQFIISLEKGDQIVKEKMIRVHRLLGENSWREISIVLKIPKGEDFDTAKVRLWNAGGDKELWMDDLKIETFVE